MEKISLKLKENIYLYGLLFLGFVLRLLYIFNFTKPELYLVSDAGGYDNRALEMSKGMHILFSTHWPPFFHIFLNFIYRPIIWLGLEDQRIKINIIIFSLLYIIAFWCIYQIVKKLFSEKTALIILIILLLWYPFIFLNYLIMSENLFFPLVFLGLYFLIVKPKTLGNSLLIGLFWGTAVITRPIFALTLPFFIFWGLYYKINWKFLLGITVISSAIIFSMMAFNFFYTGGVEKSISSGGGFNFAMSWCDVKTVRYAANGYYFWFTSPANYEYPDDKIISTNTPFENQDYYYEMGINCIKNNPWIIVENLSSIKNLFHSHLFPTIWGVTGWENFRLLFKILTGFTFIGAVSTIFGLLTNKIEFNKKNKKYLYLFAIIIISLFISIYLQNVGEERYIIPYAPLLIILSLPTVFFLSKRWKLLNKNIFDKWVWFCYLLFIIITVSIFKFSSVTIEKAYLIKPNETKDEITLPFQNHQFDNENLKYEIILNSNIKQQANINITFDDILEKISVNGKIISLSNTKAKNNKIFLDAWERGYIIKIPLEAGDNNILLSGLNTGWGYSLKINQKPAFIIWMLLIASVGLPVSHLFIIFLRLLYEKNNTEKN